MRAFPVRLPSGVRYWTVLNEDLAVVAEADAFLRHVRFGRDGSELTTRSYAGAIALFLRWCVRTSRDWHDGVAALGLFITWLRHAGPQSSGVEVVVGGQVLAGPGVADKSLICPLGASSMAQASTGSIPSIANHIAAAQARFLSAQRHIGLGQQRQDRISRNNRDKG